MSPFSELESKIVGWMGVGTEPSQPMDVTGEKKNPHTLQYHPLKLTNRENMIRNTAFKSTLLFCSYSPNKNIINLKIKPPLTFAPIITDGPLIRVLFFTFSFKVFSFRTSFDKIKNIILGKTSFFSFSFFINIGE